MNKWFAGFLGIAALVALPVVCLGDDKEEETTERRKVEIEREVHKDTDDPIRRRYGDDVEHEKERIEIREKTDREHEEDD